jgi:CheY-like chemotaxis protein
MMRLTFIVIDDSELDCFIIKRIIQHIDEDFVVLTYHNAVDALNAMKKAGAEAPYFSMVFLDLKMPVMNGFQFLDEFEKLPSAVKERHRILILSTTRNPSDISRLMSYDMVDSIIEKPITKEKLYSLLSDLNTEV